MKGPSAFIFREQAIKNRWQRRQKDVLPHLIAVPIFLFLWGALGILLLVLIFLLPLFSGLLGW